MSITTFSILIPAYEYEEGIERILKHFSLKSNEGVNILISDDSKSNKIKNIVLGSTAYKTGKVKYNQNKPSLGAVKNWNSLIANSESDYIFVLHQDECPVDINFYSELRKTINDNKNPDLVFLRCAHLVSQNTYSPFLISIIIRPILSYFFQYLLIRNVIGSPSNLVLKRSIVNDFDNRLQWLVDVEWFYSLLKKRSSWIFAKDIKILSVVDTNTSITSSIINNIKKIMKNEIRYISYKHKSLNIFRLKDPKTIFDYFLKYAELFIWYCIRFTSFLSSMFFLKKLPYWW